MLFKKCKYYNHHQTACCLMIDDLIPAAVSFDGVFGPYNDWGFLKNENNSLFHYLENNLFNKYPEIRGTVFMPFEAQDSIINNGYRILKGSFDSDFIRHLDYIKKLFELAFHGIKHTWVENYKMVFEFENFDNENNEFFRNTINQYEKLMGIKFSGGKFPGYKYNKKAISFLQYMNFKWCALNAGMMNRKHIGNRLSYIENTNIVNIPSNISGNLFNIKPGSSGIVKKIAKRTIYPNRFINPEIYLQYLYENSLPITIQEHYSNQRTDGKRQTPNIYDDIYSLEQIYGLLRPLDIWHATCSEIAHYYDSYKNTGIISNENTQFDIQYHDNWNSMFLSFVSDCPMLIEISTGKNIHGFAKNGRFVFNRLKPGNYKLCH